MKIKSVIQIYLGTLFLITVLIASIIMDINMGKIVTDKVGEVFLELTEHNGQSIENKLLSYKKAINSIVIDEFIVNSLLKYDTMTGLEQVNTELAIEQTLRPVLIFEEGIRSVGYWLYGGIVEDFGEIEIELGPEELRYNAYFKKNYADKSPDADRIISNYATLHINLNEEYHRLYLTQDIVDDATDDVVGGVFIVIDTTKLFNNIISEASNENLVRWDNVDAAKLRAPETHTLVNQDNTILMDRDISLIGTKVPQSLTDQMPNERGLINTDQSIIAYYRFSEEYLLVNSYPKEAINKEINRNRWFIALIVLLFLLLIFFVGLLIGNYIEKRFSDLKILMNQLEQGNFLLTKKRISDPSNEFDDILNHFHGMVAKVEQLIQENYINELDKREAELNALQYQINPHFLFNTLEIISAKARIQKIPDIEMISKNLGQLFRYNMNRDNINLITVEDELNHISNYMTIQNLHYNQGIDLFLDVDHKYYHNIAIRFLMQPIIENCIVHGMEKHQGGTIEITAYDADGYIVIDISDDGIGIHQSLLQNININMNLKDKRDKTDMVGLGLRNVNRRLKLVFGESYGLTINSDAIGTTVSVKLPHRYLGD